MSQIQQELDRVNYERETIRLEIAMLEHKSRTPEQEAELNFQLYSPMNETSRKLAAMGVAKYQNAMGLGMNSIAFGTLGVNPFQNAPHL